MATPANQTTVQVHTGYLNTLIRQLDQGQSMDYLRSRMQRVVEMAKPVYEAGKAASVPQSVWDAFKKAYMHVNLLLRPVGTVVFVGVSDNSAKIKDLAVGLMQRIMNIRQKFGNQEDNFEQLREFYDQATTFVSAGKPASMHIADWENFTNAYREAKAILEADQPIATISTPILIIPTQKQCREGSVWSETANACVRPAALPDVVSPSEDDDYYYEASFWEQYKLYIAGAAVLAAGIGAYYFISNRQQNPSDPHYYDALEHIDMAEEFLKKGNKKNAWLHIREANLHTTLLPVWKRGPLPQIIDRLDTKLGGWRP